MKKSAFTFWELLAVLLIIAVVAAILYPVFAKARQPRWHNLCPSNEKQLGLALTQYVQDNDEMMPNIGGVKDQKSTWRTMIYPYAEASGLYQCPERGDKLNGPDGLPRCYAVNYTGNYSGGKIDKGNGAFAGRGSKPISIEDLPAPASLIVLCEVWHSDQPDFNIDNLGAFNPNSDMLWAGHSDGGNYLMADGHVKYFPPPATKDMWHRNAAIPLSAGAMKVLENAHKESGR